jgi:membrane protein
MATLIQRIPSLHVGRLDVVGVTRETVKETIDDDGMGLSAEMAYHALLALFPFLLLLAGLTAIIDNVFAVDDLTQRIIDKASSVMPDDATSVLETFVSEVVASNGGPAIILGALGALWAASAGVGSAMKALNRAYDVEEDRGFIKRKLVALLLTLAFGGLILAAAILIGTGQFMAAEIGEALGWRSELITLWNWLTLPAAVILVMLAVSLLYWLGPNTRQSYRWITPGAVLFTFAWIAASLAFAFYISNFAAYNRTYGSLAAVIILLLWLNWTSLILVVGGELNGALARRHDDVHRRDLEAAGNAGGFGPGRNPGAGHR